MLLVSDKGGGGNICGVLRSCTFSLSVKLPLSIGSSFTTLSSSDDVSKIFFHIYFLH